MNFLKIIVLLLASASVTLAGNIVRKDGIWNVSGQNYNLRISENGIPIGLESGGKSFDFSQFIPVKFETDKGDVDVSNSSFKGSRCENGRLFFDYENQYVDYSIVVIPAKKYLDFTLTFNVKDASVRCIRTPFKVSVDPDLVEAVNIVHGDPQNMGIELNASFFKEQADNVGGDINYVKSKSDDSVFAKMSGENIKAFPTQKSKIISGRDSSVWFGKDTKEVLDMMNEASANLPLPNPDISILESENGTFIGGYTFGGKGAFVCVGGNLGSKTDEIMSLVEFDIYKVALKNAAKSGNAMRKRIAMFNVKFENDNGGGRLDMHRGRFRSDSSILSYDGDDYFVITSPAELLRAMKAKDTLMIVNPFRGVLPVPYGMTSDAFASAVKKFVQDGGYWVERGDYPFRYTMKPDGKKWLTLYGGAAGDFSHMKIAGINMGMYSVQPFDETRDFKKATPFNKCTSIFSGTPEGASLGRYWPYFVEKHENFELPVTRITFGKDLFKSAKSFCVDNKITRKYYDKAPRELLEKFAKSPVLMFWGDIREDSRLVEKAPVPSIIHIATYCYGTYDSQYPDLLPPNAAYGTPEEFKALIDRIHERGLLFMPYTNNSWWCENPRGPTFTKYGNAGLVLNKDGLPCREIYGVPTGYTTCMWAKEALDANARIIDGFKYEYPADVVFQDQVGSRNFIRYDTNPASPTRNSYLDGLIRSTMLDSQKMPLSTEDGWAHIANYEIQFCGFTFGVMEPHHRKGVLLHWQRYPKSTYKLSNVVGALFQDKVALTQHNLAGTVKTESQISASMLYGLQMIAGVAGWKNNNPEAFERVYWIAALQRNLAWRFVGDRLKAFDLEWANNIPDDGRRIGRAKYGKISVVANINDTPLAEGNIKIAPNGFYATSKGVLAGIIGGIGETSVKDSVHFMTVEENGKTKLHLYAKKGCEVVIPYEKGIESLSFNGEPVAFSKIDGGIKFIVPENGAHYRVYMQMDIK